MLFCNSASKCSSDKCYGTAKCSVGSYNSPPEETSGCVLPYGESRAESGLKENLQPLSEWSRGHSLAQPGGCSYVSMNPANEEMKGEGELPEISPLA